MTSPDPTLLEIERGRALAHSGNRQAARDMFSSIWSDIGKELGDPLHRCALAHAMADVQDDVRDELKWDQRALRAAMLVTEERAKDAGMTGPDAMLPSLHLNLGDCWRRLGNRKWAQHHLVEGRAALESLGTDGYARLVTDGLARLAERLEAE
jgi:hypothetical protein